MSSFATKVENLHRFFEKELGNTSSALSEGVNAPSRTHVGSDVERFMKAPPNQRWTLARKAAQEAANVSWSYANEDAVEDLR